MSLSDLVKLHGKACLKLVKLLLMRFYLFVLNIWHVSITFLEFQSDQLWNRGCIYKPFKCSEGLKCEKHLVYFSPICEEHTMFEPSHWVLLALLSFWKLAFNHFWACSFTWNRSWFWKINISCNKLAFKISKIHKLALPHPI